ncbi:MAG: glycosyltransferase [Candidatus Thermoplasmatota archaeon]|nr:glycosyltransferase [Euryarchaeota archaeon]MBU4032670.1 glycosyltransferase [Candidatus Thermoplasmatota archaeon]MBU4071084.1 glycosyltransferase [Candidatus Thermoplasmatota archaeon]MBU4145177.1 glycosyltransferase [Candidatus Thermoplasmatota archaeon]MBU4591128.1 glycosyltransferase [Candidatus Thermoplasmatota archaeon]
MKFSAVIIARNAELFIRDCLDSLVHQSRKPDEVLVVDSESTDSTQAIVKEYSAKWPFVKLLVYSSLKGEGRNYGVKKSSGDIVAFIDSDAIAHALWIEEMIKAMENADVVAGREVRLGYHGFTSLKRVGMLHKGSDVTYPSVNLAYKKSVFEAIEGFDPWFKEAEDVDINFRAVDAGYKLIYCPTAIVYHNARSTFTAFFKQAFWYGFGRKELSLRHGNLWRSYSPMEMVRVSKEENIWKLIRLVISFFGYMFCKVVGKKQTAKDRLRKSKASER